MSNALEILGLESSSICNQSTTGSMQTAIVEMKTLFQERLPYTTVLLLDGNCYVWGEAFIQNILTSMATDNLSSMTAEERRTWYLYVDWCNNHTNSADLLLATTAIGCTIPDESGNSYIVLADGTITATLCETPLYDIPKPELYKSLDNVLMSILNCEPYNLCASDAGDLYSVTTCTN
jgi:hypothetical protein